MEETRRFSAGTLPGQLGFSEREVKLAAGVVKDALAEKITSVGNLLDMLRSLVTDPDRTPLEAVLDEMEEQTGLLSHSISMRALALGLRIGREEAKAGGPAE